MKGMDMAEVPSDSEETFPVTGMARMMSLDRREALWLDSDKADILRHQLSVPVVADLRRCSAVDEATLSQIQDLSAGIAPPTFAQVLYHPAPSLQLLRAIKDFGKSAAQEDGPLPSEVAYVLYYAAILVARLRHDEQITAMDDLAIREGAEWAIQQPWVDEATRKIYVEGIAKLKGSGSE
jgi:hypothetical protein